MKNKYTKPSVEDGIFIMPWEKAFRQILTPFEEFTKSQITSAILLMFTTILALVLANTDLSENYNYLKNIYISFSVNSWEIKKTLHHWVNDGLMAFFFFVVGLELKREILVGELSNLSKAILPIGAAIGGMAVPALIYFLTNPEGDAARGWAIPMATDIAFAIGVLALLGKRVPRALVTFLVALAIVDDLGAVTVIAVFYTETITFSALLAAVSLFVLLMAFNYSGIRAITPYFIVAIFLWYALSASGIHATLAGILGAFTVPAIPKYQPERFIVYVENLMKRFESSYQSNENILKNAELRTIVQTLERGTQSVATMLQRLEHIWHIPVSYLVIPIFALVNAGIPLTVDSLYKSLTHPVTLGISLGLLFGKIIGISGMSWLLLKANIAKLPQGVHFSQITGVSLLAGIGFTMSIFIAELGFEGREDLLVLGKTGILFTSLISGISGFTWLFIFNKTQPSVQ